MTRFRLILNNFIHYFKANLLVALGVAISTAVLTGALIIGDSVRYSLEKSTYYRLGNTTHLVSSVDRYFRKELAGDLEQKGELKAAPVLILEGMTISDGGLERVNKVQVTGVDERFKTIGSLGYDSLKNNEVIVSSNLAERLGLEKGSEFLVRIEKASLIPLNAPFVSDAETSVSFRAVIKGIADRNTMGFFNLKNSQTAPYNLFLSLSKLNELMEFSGKANHLLIVSAKRNQQVEALLEELFTPEDGGLIIKNIPLTNEKEIVSERVFMDKIIVQAFRKFSSSRNILTYFVNGIQFKDKVTPYSFVSAIENDSLSSSSNPNISNLKRLVSSKNLSRNEIIINNWVSTDLGAKAGDTVTLKYFVIGPLRQLVEREDDFLVKEVVPIEGKYADRELMPYLPGLSDAENCRDWDTGTPVNLDAIRDKDEDYWNQYKGTPKAFISMDKAQEIWSNRFGNYTAIRINENNFSEKEYRKLFSASVKPVDLGITVTPVRQTGLNAAKNGVDFSQLFLGLSFFLLMAALILIALLFLLNLENRQSQVGTLTILGFTHGQIRKMLLMEGLIITVSGALIGLLVAVLYSRLIFIALNTMWWEIVRTSVLEVKINFSTLATGMFISILVSLAAVLFSINRSLKKQAVELQRLVDKQEKPYIRFLKKGTMLFSLVISLVIVAYQFLASGTMNPSLFFLSGGLLLTGLLLFADYRFRRNKYKFKRTFSTTDLSKRNSSRNSGRSLTVVILFALGTFLVVSTGANRQGLFSANEKSGGTGGFLYFAETSIPVLYDLNDKKRRAEEGIEQKFTVAQFSKADGDDASCLNLNRVSNPAILGVDPKMMEGRFSFAAKASGYKDFDPWQALTGRLHDDTTSRLHEGTTSRLQEKSESGESVNSAYQHISTSKHQHISTSAHHIIPAIADQTVIQWGLGKKAGDTLFYRNELGDTLGLKLIAGLSPSIFQGYVLISQDDFLKNYPTSSGSNVFLIEGSPEKSEAIGQELKSVFRDHGWEMSSAAERLMEFNSVTNTYLTIFLALGALGLILGTVGLAIVLARSILERKSEIALLQALGLMC